MKADTYCTGFGDGLLTNPALCIDSVLCFKTRAGFKMANDLRQMRQMTLEVDLERSIWI